MKNKLLSVILLAAFVVSFSNQSNAQTMPPGADPKLWARASIIDWKAQERLPLLKQPLLVLRPKDSFWEAGARVAKLVPGAKVVDLPDQDKRLLETQAQLAARHVTSFLSA